MSLFLIAIVQSLLFSVALSQGTCKATSDVKLTFYGMAEGGILTAFACGNNGGKAGGIGTYSNPETFATSRSNPAFSKCEIVYIPYLQKYFQFSDYCVQCDTDFKTSGALHIDLWIGATTNSGSALCEDDWGSIPGQTIIQSPPSTLPVNSGELWDGTSCHDASSSDPFVYPNPSTSGLCSGGSSSPGSGSLVGGQSSSSTPPPPPPATSTPPAPVVQPSTTPIVQRPVAPITSVPSSSPASSSSTSDIIFYVPTTFITTVTFTSSKISAISSPTSSSSSYSPKTAGCIPGHGCLGDPCQKYGDCAGEWICMGTPGTCHDNMKD